MASIRTHFTTSWLLCNLILPQYVLFGLILPQHGFYQSLFYLNINTTKSKSCQNVSSPIPHFYQRTTHAATEWIPLGHRLSHHVLYKASSIRTLRKHKSVNSRLCKPYLGMEFVDIMSTLRQIKDLKP